MGRIATGKRKYHVKRLTPLHFNILELVSLGHRNKKIAERLGISRQTVSNVKNSAIAQPLLARMGSVMDEAIVDDAYQRFSFIRTLSPRWKDLRRSA